MSFKYLIFCLGLSLLAGCSPMKVKDCKDANWKDIGFNDGANGRSVWLKSRSEVCAKANITPNKQAYFEGYKIGSRLYCTIENGVDYGRTGHDLPIGVCTDPILAKRFQRGYVIGYRFFQDLEDQRARYRWLHSHYHKHSHHKHRHKK